MARLRVVIECESDSEYADALAYAADNADLEEMQPDPLGRKVTALYATSWVPPAKG